MFAPAPGSGSRSGASILERIVALAIEPYRVLSAEPFPTPQGDLDVDRVDLHRVAAGASPLGGDERRARAAEGLVQRIACPQVVADRGLEQHKGLLRRMVERGLGAPTHDHLRTGDPPDRGLV